MVPRCWIVSMCLGLSILLVNSTRAGAQPPVDLAPEFAALGWHVGPTEADLGGMAKLSVPAGYRFVGPGGAGKFMELNENPSDGSELGVLLSDDLSWFVVFEYSSAGYIKDDDRKLDAEKILSSIREGTARENKIRRERGWPTMEIVGWHQQPFYDPRTNNLTWAIRGNSDGGASINHSTRILGRRGVMKVNLVLSPEHVGNALPAFDSLMTRFSLIRDTATPNSREVTRLRNTDSRD